MDTNLTATKLATQAKLVWQRPFIRRGSAAAVLLVLLVFVPAMTLAPVPPAWVPEPLALWALDTRLLIGRPLTTLASLAQAVQGETAVTFSRDGERVEFESDGLTIAGTLYGAEEAARKPAVLLLHGSTPQGRKLGLYRLMGSKLAEQGYVVLTIDQRGFGQSDNPPDVQDAASFDFVADVNAALAYLVAAPGVDPDEIYLVGHSFGGDVALTAVADGGALVEKLVLIGPGRHFLERGGTPGAPEFDYFRRREMRYMFLWRAIPEDVFIDYRTVLPLENHNDYLAQPSHVPLLLLDGALESSDDQRFLQDVYETAVGEKAYITLENADHYANTANFGPLIIYDETAVDQLIKGIDRFLDEE
ncbi:MAG: alpha/beta fold hydrolase [Anaerolineaceae bacterium]|nr:alpha/beta fold hydrolase [Anaerolineaceae bacterium]